MASKSKRWADRLADECKDAGHPVTRCGNGWKVRTPSGSVVTIHRTSSDWRAERNMRSFLRRLGVDLTRSDT